MSYQAVVKVSTACEARSNAPRRLRDTEISYDFLGVSASSVALSWLAARGSDFHHGLLVSCLRKSLYKSRRFGTVCHAHWTTQETADADGG